MKAEYDFRKGRRGVKRALPPRNQLARHTKVRISIMLDADLLEHFKAEAAKAGGLPWTRPASTKFSASTSLEEPAPPNAC